MMIKLGIKRNTRKANKEPTAAVMTATTMAAAEKPADANSRESLERGQEMEGEAPTTVKTFVDADAMLPSAKKVAIEPTATGISFTASRAPAKLDTVIAMLRRPDGATVAEMMAATNWQTHSVRGFLSGTVKKKFGLNLGKTKGEDGELIYRIIPNPVESELDEVMTADNNSGGTPALGSGLISSKPQSS